MENTEVVDWFDANKCGKNNKFVNVIEEGRIEYKKDTIENAINSIIINKLADEKNRIEDIALNVISDYRSKLLEHMQTTIINVITNNLEKYLTDDINSKDITKKIVDANVKNFKDLLSERTDKQYQETYKNLLNFAKICEAKKKRANGGKPKRKKYTRKSHNKSNKQKTRRIKGGADECLDVDAICGKVTSIINKQAQAFETETVNEFNKTSETSELKDKLETVCLDKTNELLNDFSKQAIDISSLDDIFKMLIFEITNIVTSNMKNLDETICKK